MKSHYLSCDKLHPSLHFDRTLFIPAEALEASVAIVRRWGSCEEDVSNYAALNIARMR